MLSAAMLANKNLAGVHCPQVVNYASEGIHLRLETHQKDKNRDISDVHPLNARFICNVCMRRI